MEKKNQATSDPPPEAATDEPPPITDESPSKAEPSPWKAEMVKIQERIDNLESRFTHRTATAGPEAEPVIIVTENSREQESAVPPATSESAFTQQPQNPPQSLGEQTKTEPQTSDTSGAHRGGILSRRRGVS